MQTITQDDMQYLRSFFTRRGCFGTVTLLDLLATPYGRSLILLQNYPQYETDVIEREFLSKDHVECKWRMGKVVIGGGQECMPLAWLRACTCFWDELSTEARRNFTTACSTLTLHYRQQERLSKQISWKDFGEAI